MRGRLARQNNIKDDEGCKKGTKERKKKIK